MVKRKRIKKIIVPLVALLLVVASSVSLFYYGRDPQRVAELKSYGYLGAFLVSLIGNATILLPLAVLPILSAIGVILYPVTGTFGLIMIGLVGGVGAGIGEMTAYMLGYSGRGVVENRRMYLRLVEWMKRWGTLAVFVNALVPFCFDIAGMAAGALRLPLWKFVLACWLGRTVNYVVFIFLVAVWGWGAILRFFG